MKATLLRTDGTEEPVIEIEGLSELEPQIGYDGFDTVNLRDGRFMIVNDMGHHLGLPYNEKATELYRSVCIPGTTHFIVGDVAIVEDMT